MKDIYVSCPICNLPLNASAAVLDSLSTMNSKVVDGLLNVRVKCDICNKNTVQVTFDEITDEKPQQHNDPEKLIN